VNITLKFQKNPSIGYNTSQAKHFSIIKPTQGPPTDHSSRSTYHNVFKFLNGRRREAPEAGLEIWFISGTRTFDFQLSLLKILWSKWLENCWCCMRRPLLSVCQFSAQSGK